VVSVKEVAAPDRVVLKANTIPAARRPNSEMDLLVKFADTLNWLRALHRPTEYQEGIGAS
jgi:hypothetical protein